MTTRPPVFWSRVEMGAADSCWPYVGAGVVTPSGHVRIAWQGRKAYVHRVAYLLVNGDWPEPLCRHTCDNPPCVNPAHLLPGTALDNARDRDERCRRVAPSGPDHCCAKLTVRDLAELQEAKLLQVGVEALAEDYGVSRSTIYKAWRRMAGNETLAVAGAGASAGRA